MSYKLTAGVIARSKRDKINLMQYLIAGFNFNDSLDDISDNQLTLTNIGDNQYSFVAGRDSKQAISLIGTNHFTFPNPALSEDDEVTFCSWAQIATDKRHGIFYTGVSEGQILGTNIILRQQGFVKPNSQIVSASQNIYTLNNWYHIAITYKDGVFQMFLDGVVIPITQGNATGYKVGATFRVGASSDNTRRWEGLLQESYIFNKSLTEQEIQTVMQGL